MNHNPKEIANIWNFSIAVWLKRYVYKRATLVLKGTSSLPMTLTVFTSALWHGVHPSNITFIISSILYLLCHVRSHPKHRKELLFQLVSLPKYTQSNHKNTQLAIHFHSHCLFRLCFQSIDFRQKSSFLC